jgi:hypothetical protein
MTRAAYDSEARNWARMARSYLPFGSALRTLDTLERCLPA